MLSKNLKIYRAKKDISQKDLADFMNVQMSTISNWENDVSGPDNEQLIKLADYFGVSVDVLLGATKDDEPKETSKPQPLDQDAVNIMCQVPLLNTSNKKVILDMIKSMLKNQK